MTKYTPGPWCIEDPMGPETPWIVEAGKPTHQWRCIAILETDEFTPAEARANHRLLVSAPMMAEALLKVVRAGSRDQQLVAHAAAIAALEEAGLIARTSSPEKPSPEALAHELWQDLLEKDDRTSPEEYPDMALITQDEFFAALDRFRAAEVEAERMRCAAIVAAESFRDDEAWDRVERQILTGASP